MKYWFKFLLIGLFFTIFLVVSFNFHGFSVRWNLWDNYFGSFFAGISITIVLFILEEFVFRVNLNGEWEVIEFIDSTSYLKYKNYKIHYTFHILQLKNKIQGFGEKTKQEESETNVTVFDTDKRVRVEFEGYIEKGYLRATQIYLLVYEYGRIRETSATYVLEIKSKSALYGKFKSTAAQSSGRIEMKLSSD